MPITGQLFLGSERLATASRFGAVDPTSRQALTGEFSQADHSHVERACRLAAAAYQGYRDATLETRARFLETCAANLMSLGDELLLRAAQESGLPRARLEGERGRTMNQLRLFAAVVRRGDWLGLRIDPSQPERKPLPRSDLRLRKIPLGPVVVFGASNFPLAFSAAGGDVASALAAGCPVVVKGHPAHPGASELAAGAIVAAAQSCGLPEGTYSHLSGTGNELGEALVSHPAIHAVAFTGSRQGGISLVNLAARRPVPIPVYAEMSSINPVVLLPEALATRAQAIATGFVASLTLGVGQFCTNPGLVLALDDAASERFVGAAAAALGQASAGTMLTDGIHSNFERGIARLAASATVRPLARGTPGGAGQGRGALFKVRGSDFLRQSELGEEVFGPSSLVVVCSDEKELAQALSSLEGQLTATLHLEPKDYPLAARLLPLLEQKAGRILVNGWPTGVEVAPAMVHGGPFPSTSDSRTTSVGTLAIDRFLRPVCYQDLPMELLPDELKDTSTASYRRMIDGQYSD